MPFGNKTTPLGRTIDFDVVYRDVIVPAVTSVGMMPMRSDEETNGGIIHRSMFERLLLCPYAVADLTLANANVFYELGIRHAMRSGSTTLLYAPEEQELPFDVSSLRAIPYRLSPSGEIVALEELKSRLSAHLAAARKAPRDSPMYGLLENLSPPDLARLRTDLFLERSQISEGMKAKLLLARGQGLEAVQALATDIASNHTKDSELMVGLLLSYRAVGDWQSMIDLVEHMDPELRVSVLVQEQLGFAWNRTGNWRQAEMVLSAVLSRTRPNSETCGILGRIYKDRYFELRAEFPVLARGFLDRAIQMYRQGFEADWRDAYPGINLATLLFLRDPEDAELNEVVALVRYANRRRLASSSDYWDYAVLLELSVLDGDEGAAMSALPGCLTNSRETWELVSTARNIRLVVGATRRGGNNTEWMESIAAALDRQAGDIQLECGGIAKST
jgi:hypothetical protein